MSQKHLKELLKQDQEPFHLKNYIAERQNQLKKPPPNSQIQLKKPKPISKSKSFSCKNACFFSIQDSSPDLRKSPLFDFSKKSPNRVFLNVPAKTASLLLDAATRIQKPKTHIRNSGFGLFGSMLKRLTQRSNRAQKLNSGEKTEESETEENRATASLKSETGENRTTGSSSSSSSSYFWYSNGRRSSLDLESSSSGRSFEEGNDEGFEFTNIVRENGVFCLSPLSPFRFSLYRSPSPEFRSSSPVKLSPRRKTEDNTSYENQSSIKTQEDEEDKEQNSPVSVLDPPFEDDEYDGHEDEDGYDLEGSYAFVQRAKQQLLQKLRRFEKLAELDPMELENILNDGEEDEHEYDYESFKFEEHTEVDELIDEISMKNGFEHKNNSGFKRLVYDLIIEEEEECDEEVVMKRVCKRLESWNELESNTIDSTVRMDLRRGTVDWKNSMVDQNADMAIDVEAGIFAILVEEVVEDMCYTTCCGV